MKKIIFLLSIIFLSITLKAQENIEIGAIYVPQITSILNFSHNNSIYKNRLTFAGAAGLTFTYNFNKKYAFQTGVLYNSHNQKFRSEIRIADGESRPWVGKKRLDYLKLPLLLKYSMPYSKKIIFHVYTGPQLSYLLKADGGVVVWEHYDNHDFYDLPVSGNKYYKPFNIDGVLGFGVDYRITKVLSINVGLRTDFSFNDVENKNVTYEGESFYYYGDPDRGSSHNFTLGLQMGVAYRLVGNCLSCPSQKW